MGHNAHVALTLKRAKLLNGKPLSAIEFDIFRRNYIEILQEIYIRCCGDEAFDEIQNLCAFELGDKAYGNPRELIAQSFGNYYFGKNKFIIAKK